MHRRYLIFLVVIVTGFAAALPGQAKISQSAGLDLSVGLDYLGASKIDRDRSSREDTRTYQGWTGGFLLPTVTLSGEFDQFYFFGHLGIPLQLEGEYMQWKKNWSGDTRRYDERVVYSWLARSKAVNDFSLLTDLRFAYRFPIAKKKLGSLHVREGGDLLLGLRLAYLTYGGKFAKVTGADYRNSRVLDSSGLGNGERIHLVRPMVLVGLDMSLPDPSFYIRSFLGLSPLAFYSSRVELDGEVTESESVLALAAMLDVQSGYYFSETVALYAHVSAEGVLGGEGTQKSRQGSGDNFLTFAEMRIGLGVEINIIKPVNELQITIPNLKKD